MQYNHLGKAGIKISELSYGSWVTFGQQIDINQAKECIHTAYDYGVNFFDNAEVYANGLSELIMGEILRDFKREHLVLSTKIFWGENKPNQTGLSRKHLLEGTKNSLRRMQLDYVDLLFCHRPDPETPIEETVLAMDYLVRGGYALYWGTSMWSAEQIEDAYQLANDMNCIPPTMEQPQYNMFYREKVEKEFKPLYDKYKMGTTIWSPLASGVLTGKYNKGIPEGSRLDRFSKIKEFVADWLKEDHLNKVEELMKIADDLSCSMAQLALAWCLKNPNVSTVITGATKIEQIKDNMQAIEVKDKLTDEIMDKIEKILR
jgi:voltage-dependent potassium channel beta subunit